MYNNNNMPRAARNNLAPTFSSNHVQIKKTMILMREPIQRSICTYIFTAERFDFSGMCQRTHVADHSNELLLLLLPAAMIISSGRLMMNECEW